MPKMPKMPKVPKVEKHKNRIHKTVDRIQNENLNAQHENTKLARR